MAKKRYLAVAAVAWSSLVFAQTTTNYNTTSTSTNTNTNINQNTDVSTSTVDQTVNSTTNSTVNSTNLNTNRNFNESTSTSTNFNTNRNFNESASTSTSTNLNTNVSTSESTNLNTNINDSRSVNTNVNQSTSSSTSENTNVNQNNNVNVSDSKSYSESVNRQVIDQNIKSPPPSAIAPSMMSYSQDLCTTGISGAVQTQILGFSGGKTIRDKNCEALKLSKTLYDMGMRVAAVSLLCQDTRVFEAMRMAGTPCPFEGKIGKEASAAWDEKEKSKPSSRR
jgi:outer membrane usher protein FimD/PapC